MSAISGVLRLNGESASRGQLEAMMGSMAHRGPDGSGSHLSDSVGLAHQMLWTTDESLHEEQPVHAADRYTLVADARLDNRGELVSILRPPQSESLSDSELLLLAFLKWSEACVDHLVGAFAFAVWDSKERTLFCARDHFGLRSLYYHYRPDRLFAFATEPKALLCLPDVPTELNEGKIADWLLSIPGEAESTLFKHVKKVPPANWLQISPSKFTFHQYWVLEPSSLGDRSDEQYAEGFLDAFNTAVGCRLRSAFPIGVQLSGGLDSSFVACVARDQLVQEGRPPLRAFSAIFDETPESDERDFIDDVVATGDIISETFSLEHIGPIANLEAEYKYIDTGPIGGAHHLIWNTYERVSKSGVRVLLDGLDGDTTVNHGWLRFAELARDGLWRQFVREALLTAKNMETGGLSQPRHERFRSWDNILRLYGLPELDRLAERGSAASVVRAIYQLHDEAPNLKPWVLVRRYLRRGILRSLGIGGRHRRNETLSTGARLLNPDFSARLRSEDYSAQSHYRPGEATTVRDHHLGIFRSGLVSSVLETTSTAASVFSLDARHPFFDKRLVEYCVSLPSDQFLRNGWSRFIMRRAMQGIVPDSIRWRPDKADLQKVYRKSLFAHDGSQLRDLLANPGPLAQYVDMDVTRSMLTNPDELAGEDLEFVARLASVYKLLERYESAWASTPEAHDNSMRRS